MAKKIVVDVEFKGLDSASKKVGDIVEETKSLKQQFRDAQKELQTLAGADIVDEAKLQEAIARTAELKDRMNDVNEQVGVLTAGSKFEKMSNNLGDIGSKIASLDFEGANESAQRLLNFSKSITFADAAKGVKQLGSTFLNLGKALLTNPLFLLAAIITGIVIAIVKLLDKIGVLKVIMNALGKVFEFVGDVIDTVVQALKDFADWLGITNNAAEDAAQKQAEAAEKTAVAYEDKSARVIQGIDQEIRMNELSGKSTEGLERKKVYWIMKTAEARAKADRLAFQSARMKGELDEEELKALEDKYKESQLAYQQSINDVKYFEASVKKEKDDARKKELEAQKEADNKAAENRKKAAEESKKARQAALAEIRKVEKEYADSLLTDQQREINAVNDKYKQLIESAKKYNQDITKLTEAQNSEISKINDKYAKEEQQKNYEKNKEISDAFAELQLTIEELENAHLDKALSDQEKEENAVRDKYFAVIEAARQKGLDTKTLEEAEKAELDAIDVAYREKKKVRDLEDQIAKIETHKQNLQLANDFANATNSLAEGIFAFSNRLGKQDEKSREQRARRQFAINKALSLSTAVITGIQSVMAAFQNGMKNPIPLLGPATAGVYAGIAGVVAAANIAKIAATKFESKGGGATTSAGGGSAGAAATGGNIPTPQLNAGALFSTGGQSTQMITSNNATVAPQQAPIKAYVVEQEITGTQQRMSNIKQQASI